MIGRTLSHYEITGRLGAGGMGEVYLARDLSLERRVALKVLPTDVAEDPSRLKRLQREAKALATLDHPNIVTVYSVEEHEGTHFLTMAYVEGRTLAELIPDGGMPTEQLLDLAIALADALRAAHERGIIHRDLKPANIMVDTEGRLRVLDFGLARVETTAPTGGDAPTQKMDDPITRQGLVMGTVPYMSPEQAEGMLLDARTDIFSMGVILYEMATGSRPFRGATPASLISSILRDDPPSMADTRPDLPAGLTEVVTRCLAKSRDDRMPSAQVLRDELEALRRQLIGSSVAGARGRSGPASSPWKRIAPPIIVAALSIAALMVWQLGLQRHPAESTPEVTSQAPVDEIRSIAVLPLRNLSGNPDQEYFADGVTEALITNLSRIGALRVTARSSSMRFKGTTMPPGEVGELLGVALLIEGSIMREQGRVRISTQLIDAAKEEVVWSERYDRHIESILALQSEVADTIARQINVVLTPQERARLTISPDYDDEAYDAYLKGTFHLYRLTPVDFDVALDYFEQSIAIDPDFALGYVGVGLVWGYRQQVGLTPPIEAGPKMRDALEKGLALDGDLSEAHGAMAAYWCWGRWDWEQAEESFEKAVELNPNLAQWRAFYSHFLNIIGRPDEAMTQIEKARKLDPLNAFIEALYGVDLLYVGRYDDAVEAFDRSLRAMPTNGIALTGLRNAHYLRGDLEATYHAQQRFLEGIGKSEALQVLTESYEKDGFETAMRQAAAVLAPEGGGVIMSAFAGDKEPLLIDLERAYEVHDPNMPYLRNPILVKFLKDEPRYQTLVKKMDFPPVDARSVSEVRQ
jgi:serine/threonine protein kinase